MRRFLVVAGWSFVVGASACAEEPWGEDAEFRSRGAEWTRIEPKGDIPQGRSSPAVGALGRFIYSFGGTRDDVVSGDVVLFDDLHRFDTTARRWVELDPAGSVPPARAFAASVVHPGSGRMFVFGGASFGPFFSDFVGLDDFWAYDIRKNRWDEIVTVGPRPEGRSRPSIWSVGPKIYLFGGITTSFQTLDDLWVYDVRDGAWTELIASGAEGSPPPRHEAQAGTRAALRRLTLYGGETIDEAFEFETLGDTWEFDLVSQEWTEVTPAAADDIDPPRNFGAAAVLGRSLFVQGGDVPGGEDCGAVFLQNPTDELWRFDLVGRTWSPVDPAGDPLARIKRTSAATVRGSMYVVGGFDFECLDDGTPLQTFNTDVFRLDPRAL